MSELVSPSLFTVPFLNTCDASRLQMVSKYFSTQALPHANCEIPKVLSIDTYKASVYESEFLKFAEDDGTVVYSGNDVIVVYYDNKDDFAIYYVPKYKQLGSCFATKLRYVKETNEKFKKGDLLFEYEGFRNGIATGGYNAYTAIIPLAAINHNDAVVVSESFAKRMKNYVRDVIIVPIYVDDVIVKNARGKYLPEVGDIYYADESIVTVNKYSATESNFIDFLFSISEDPSKGGRHTTDLRKVRVEEVEVYKISRKKVPKDLKTFKILEEAYREQVKKVSNTYKEIKKHVVSEHITREIFRRYLKVTRRRSKDIQKNLSNIVYLIRVEVVGEEEFEHGDKISTRGANKGVSSVIVPDELMPRDEYGRIVDIAISPFAIPSRMNVNQIYEIYIGKLVDYAEKELLEGNIDVLSIIDEIASKFGRAFYPQTKKALDLIRSDDEFLRKFLEDVRRNGLYVVVDSFKDKRYTKKDILDIYRKYGIKTMNKLRFNPRKLMEIVSGESLKYLPDSEVEVESLTGIMYICKIFKIASHILNARSVGPYHSILKIPTGGKARQGGSRIGNNEIDALLSYDSEYVLKEFITIKADDHDGKMDYIDSVISGKQFSISKMKTHTYTSRVVTSLAKALFVDLEKVIRDGKD